jgi:hypothetical protein
MDMSMGMNMDMPTAPAETGMPMSGMATVFSANTRVTLWFAQWVTNTPAAYASTLLFLFALGLFNRFLAALKTQLERKWDDSTNGNGAYPSLHSNAEEELEPLSPMPRTEDGDRVEKASLVRKRGFWVANAPWSAKSDGVRALFEFTRAVIGYIL